MANLYILAVYPPGPGATEICGGFVITSDSGDQLEIAFRRGWEELLDDDVTAAVLNGMEVTFEDIAAHKTIAALVAHLEETYSNLIRPLNQMKLYSDLPLNEQASLLRRGLLGEAPPAIN
ncbi:MAG: hypothetical protein JNM66_13125 [Bryobacterales bacterium]|nr:hypothetical protein [Bryobacterales bacterium]